MAFLPDELQTALGSAYTLERELGGGGMSRVFLAEETALARKVVIKLLTPDLIAGVNIERFRREIQLAARLQQAQIVPVLSAGESDGIPYYTMPFVEGESLRARIKRMGKLPVREAIGILRDVTRALAYAHEHGIVHRDIKPDNVLLSGGTAVVTDFGIAKALTAAKDAPSSDSALTQLGTSVGTPMYISPEQAAGDPNIDARSDIYSFGCMAYELLTGKPPFSDRTPQRTLVAHLTETPPPIAAEHHEIPAALAALVMRCLEKDPAARPQSASEVGAALDAVNTGSFGSVGDLVASRAIAPRTGIAIYVGACAVTALLAKAAEVAFGLPEWVFYGAVTMMVLGFPAIVLAAFETTRHVTWSRATRGSVIAFGAFASAVVAIMVLRLFGIGPAASLLAAGKLHGSERLLVVDFAAGRDSSLSHVVTEAVRTNLGQSNVVSIMPPTAIAAALQRMQRAPSTPVDLVLARDIAQREGVKAIVAGDVTPLGAGYVVSVRLVSADSGSELAAYRATVDGPGELLDAIDGLTRKLRGRIGESLKAVRDAPPLEQVTTSSLPALRKYADASRAFDLTGDYQTSVQLLREAVALDTTFAMAYRKLGVGLSNLGMPRPQVDSALTRAYQFRDRLPEKERYLTTATYFMSGPGHDRRKGIAAYERVLALDSTDLIAATNLAGALTNRREYARAESLYARLASSPRASQVAVVNYLTLMLTQGKLAQADSIARSIAERFPNATATRTLPAQFMYMRGAVDSTEAFWRARVADPNPIVRLGALNNLSSLALLHGKIAEARRLRDQVVKLNAARGIPPNPLGDSLVSAGIDIWFFERFSDGLRALDAAQAQVPLRTLSVEQRPYFGLAQYYAMGGQPAKARTLIADFDAAVQDPQDRARYDPARHMTLAEILIAEKKPLEAVREMWRSDSMPDGPATSCAHCLDGDIGRAYDLADKPDSAIFYWERYIRERFNRAPAGDATVLAGFHKRLGELYEAKGDYGRAESHYTAFVDLWKNADPELQPKVLDVKRRLAALRMKAKG
jgi:tetratricopeptide (TPR) repeat protein